MDKATHERFQSGIRALRGAVAPEAVAMREKLLAEYEQAQRDELRGDPNAVVSGGFTQAELEASFAAVRNPDDWRARIDKTVSAAELAEVGGEARVREAVIFFTATVPTFETLKGGRVRVRATGYRSGPAGP